jgi:hypothetical protein
MDWLQGEPRLDDALSDPVVQAMMRRDRVDPDWLYRFLCAVARRLDDRKREAARVRDHAA